MRRFIFLIALWALICLVMFAPVRWALAFAPDEARAQLVPESVRGTIWRGQGAAFLPKTQWPVTLNYRINPFKAALNQPFANLAFSGPGLSGSGDIGRTGGKDIKAEFELGQLPISDRRVKNVSGNVFITLDQLKMNPNCKEAQGQVRTNILASNASSWQGWSGPILSGPISCDGDNVLARLTGGDKDIDVMVDLRLTPEGRYDVDMQLRPQTILPNGLGFILSALGFEEQADGTMRLREQGAMFQGVKR